MCLSVAESQTAWLKNVYQSKKEEEGESDTVWVCQAWGSALYEHRYIWGH